MPTPHHRQHDRDWQHNTTANMTETGNRRAPVAGPTEAEAWIALLGHSEVLDKIRHPKELKEEMMNILSRSWNMSESKIEFSDLGLVWIDPHYKELTTKMVSMGPGYETFQIATYRFVGYLSTSRNATEHGYFRILKTARLEGVRQ
jgi:hypothetical protein